MPTRRFSNRNNLQNLKKQAKTLLCAYQAGDASARDDFLCHPRSVDVENVQLSDAQLVLARLYGFDSWPNLQAVVRLRDALRVGDSVAIRDLLASHPNLVHGLSDTQKTLHNDVLNALDEALPMKVHWETFYTDGKRTPPFFQNKPEESLVSYFDSGQLTAGRAIDLGCGFGRNALYMAKVGCDVTGIDLSPSAIEKAQMWANEVDLAVDFEVASVFEKEFVTEAYDIVCDSGLFHHLQPHRRLHYLNIVKHMLKPTGKFYFLCFSEVCSIAHGDGEIYQNVKMPPGLGYSEERLRSILDPLFSIEDFHLSTVMPNESDMIGMEGLWCVLMQKK